MGKDEALQRALTLRNHNVTAHARMKPHPSGWPNLTDEWEVTIRHAETGRFLPETDSRVTSQARTPDEARE